MLICVDCLKDKFLKQYSLTHSVVGQCIICRNNNNVLINVEEETFQNLFKAVIRYHYAEYHYNPHWGGDHGIQNLLLNENPIIEHRFFDDLDSDLLYDELPKESYAKDENGVSIYYGWDDEIRGLYATNLQEAESLIIKKLEERLRQENYFLIEKDVISILNPITNYIQEKISQGRVFYRARIGYEQKYFDSTNIGFERNIYYHKPYKDNKISAPPPPKTTAGRLNRHGVSYLYLSSEMETAVSEVRPHPGHLISVGKFGLFRDVVIADLLNIDLSEFCTDALIEKFILLNSIGKKFSMPITPEERDNYLITQLFAEAFRVLGFDGLVFKSSVANGYNLVLFNPSVCEYIDDESSVFKCEKVEYCIQDTNEGIKFNKDDFEVC